MSHDSVTPRHPGRVHAPTLALPAVAAASPLASTPAAMAHDPALVALAECRRHGEWGRLSDKLDEAESDVMEHPPKLTADFALVRAAWAGGFKGRN
jgi:hypothetical protein